VRPPSTPRMPRLLLLAAVPLLAPALARAQADTVRAGGAALGGRTFAVGVDSSDTFVVRNGERVLVVRYTEAVTRTADGLLVVGRNVRPTGAVLSLDSVAVDARTLAPVWHADSTRAGRTRMRYADGRLRGTRTDSAGRETPLDSAVAAGAFDYSVASRVVNLLPLRPGYTTVIASHDIHRGPQDVRITVLAEEALEHRGTTRPAWRVEADYGGFKATRWIDRETRRDLRTHVVNRGMEMIAEHYE
jgi:hypothetical protein